MKKLMFILGVCLLSLCVSAQKSNSAFEFAEESLLTNGDFETWVDGLPVNWKSACTASNAVLSQSSDARNGYYSVRVATGISYNRRLAYKELDLKAGTYSFTFYAKATVSDTCQVCPGFVSVNDGNVGYTYGDRINITSTDWTEVNYEFTLDSVATVCLLVMNPKARDGFVAAQDILVDDATLTTQDGGLQDDNFVTFNVNIHDVTSESANFSVVPSDDTAYYFVTVLTESYYNEILEEYGHIQSYMSDKINWYKENFGSSFVDLLWQGPADGTIKPLQPGTRYYLCISQADPDTECIFGNWEIYDFKTLSDETPDYEHPDYSEESDVIYMEDLDVKAGTQVQVPVIMNNSEEVVAFQFDLYVPEGVSVPLDNRGKFQITRGDRIYYDDYNESWSHTIQSSWREEEGCYRVVCTSSTNTPLTGNVGNVAYIIFEFDENLDEGIRQVVIRNAKLTHKDTYSATFDEAKTNFNVQNFTLGDVNRDNDIDLGDFVAVINIILDDWQGNYSRIAADVNIDGRVNVGDAAGIVNHVLYGWFVPSDSACATRAPRLNNTEMMLSGITYMGDGIYQMSVELLNPSVAFSGIQFDMALPSGLSLQNVKWTGRADRDHFSIHKSEQQDGTVRVIGLSSDNTEFTGTSGALMTLTLKAAGSLAEDSEIELRNICASETNTAVTNINNVRAMLNADATGIHTVNNEQLTMNNSVYNLAGQKVNALKRGIYVINGKKQVK